ncbi:MAG: helix-turn-helix domain-containing protein [Firmicutes bacterium]|nr:helix-turn-helix domain-containing protein [Bacillota bacterium]MBR3405260.1 helix-turn-helix domain-containing protein [Bacillota bacterium]
MTSTAKTIQYSGKQKLHDIVTFHGSGEDGVFYQESLVPFFLMRMTVKKDNPEASFFSIYTPETQIHVPSAAALKGRGFHSQHQHNCFEFTYVLEGDMYQLVEGKRYYYPTGSCCLMNRNTLHTEERSSDYTCIFLSVSPEFVRKLMNDGKPLLFPGEQALYRNLIFEFFQQNLEDSTKDRKDFIDFVPKITQPEQVERVHQLFEKLQQTLIQPEYGASFRLLELLSKLIGILGDPDCYSGEHVTAQSNMESLLFARINRILSERRGRVTNAELSALLSYNGSYLGRIVKKYTGKSLFDYSMVFTMEYVSDQLLHTKKTAAQIASELQFTNLTHFYKLFKDHYGCTPKAYRSASRTLRSE